VGSDRSGSSIQTNSILKPTSIAKIPADGRAVGVAISLANASLLRRLASQIAKVWHLDGFEAPTLFATLAGHREFVNNVAAASDGRFICRGQHRSHSRGLADLSVMGHQGGLNATSVWS
jgi:hypothetical protein